MEIIPKNTQLLRHIISKIIDKNEELHTIDLNWLDVSDITDMSKIFPHSNFNGNISQWNVSNVTNMSNMFSHSKFNGDISKWDVSNVTDMKHMFKNSKFNRDDYFLWNIKKDVGLEEFHPEKEINDYKDYIKLKKERFRDINFIRKYLPIIISKIC